jgi:hypothetical protein
MRSESNIQSDIMIAVCKLGARLFRNNVGLGWIGKSEIISSTKQVLVYPGDVVIRQARPLHAGLTKGSSDLIGWDKDGRFLAVECKTATGRATTDQVRFIDAVNRMGGRAGIARSAKEAVDIAGMAR